MKIKLPILCIHLLVVNLLMLSIAEVIAFNARMISESVKKYSWPNLCSIFAWKNRRKPWNTSVRITYVQTKI
jgi:hypothetical protein